MTPPSSSRMARPGSSAAQCPSPHRTFCTVSCGRDAKRTGRIPAWRARSAFRPARLPERTAANVAAARTKVPTAVPHEALSVPTITQALQSSPFDHPHLLLIVVRTRGWREFVEPVDLRSAQLDSVRSHVLLDPGLAFRAGNRGDVVALGQEPGQSNLTRRHAELSGYGFDLVDEALIALEVLAHEAWIGLAEVAVVKLVQ